MENTMKTANTTDTAAITAVNGAEVVMRVKTKLGTLIAYPSTDPEHPGIYIDLQREECRYDAPIVLVEYTNDDASIMIGEDIPASIVSRAWGNAMSEEFTDAVYVRNLEEFFAEED